MTSIIKTWGTNPEERRLGYPCDEILPHPDFALYRGVTINAPAKTIFRWLCQMRVAPYSYDWIDNGGRKSPQELSAGLENLEVGQEVMRIFTLVSFEPDRHFTIRIKPDSTALQTFGDLVISYLIVPLPRDGVSDSCRLLVKIVGTKMGGAKGRFMGAVLPWGDLIMMRRQLLNFKYLAESSSPKGPIA